MDVRFGVDNKMNLLAHRNVGAVVVAVLALVQTAAGVLRALGWFHRGSDLMGQGLLLLPLIGMIAYARGALIAVIALLYGFFAWAILTGTGQRWARPIGIVAAIVNLLLVVSVVVQGETLLRALLWSIVPVIILWRLFATGGRDSAASGRKAVC